MAKQEASRTMRLITFHTFHRRLFICTRARVRTGVNSINTLSAWLKKKKKKNRKNKNNTRAPDAHGEASHLSEWHRRGLARDNSRKQIENLNLNCVSSPWWGGKRWGQRHYFQSKSRILIGVCGQREKRFSWFSLSLPIVSDYTRVTPLAWLRMQLIPLGPACLLLFLDIHTCVYMYLRLLSYRTSALV